MKLKEVMTSMDYEKLYKAYYLQVYSYTISLAKNREIAEEITQNTFYKAVSTTSQFKGKSDVLTWRSAYTSFFTVWKNHTKKSFSFAYSGNYLFHKSLQFLEKQNHGRELLIIVQS